METVPSVGPERIDKAMMDELTSYLDENMNEFIVTNRQRMRKKWDILIAITGRKGVGKSTLGILMCKLLDYQFTLDRLAYSPEEIIPILRSMPEFSAMMMDEAGEAVYRGDYASRVSKAIIKQTIGDRWLHSVRSLLAPSIFNLDKSLIPLLDYWIKVYCPDGSTRGYAEIREMSERDYRNDKIPYAPAIYDVKFDDLPEDVAYIYEQFKAQKGAERMERYGKLISEESGIPNADDVPPVDFDKIQEEVVRKIDAYLSPKTDMVDWRLVHGKFRSKGLSKEDAKSVANWINKLRNDGYTT